MPARALLITGAAGYIGRQLVAALASDRRGLEHVVATDVRDVPAGQRQPGIEYRTADIRDAGLVDLLRTFHIDAVAHLAAIVTPRQGDSPELLYSVDVRGTENVLTACVAAGVRQLIVTSSGAAYGYHADNPSPLRETDALRGNDTFAYSRHKRLVEELLARYRREHPQLGQLIFRPGAILGDTVSNQITDLFEKPLLLGVRGAHSPYVFIWDQDVVACIIKGICEERTGIYNLAGDGVMTVSDLARYTGKRYVAAPAFLIRGALRLLQPLGLSQYGPEQVDFLRYRPVLSNEKLKGEFGYVPRLTTREVFERYWRSRHGDR